MTPEELYLEYEEVSVLYMLYFIYLAVKYIICNLI